ncbi:MAG: nucleotide-binding universal stress UspA family protein [Planctomycetota bacterium]
MANSKILIPLNQSELSREIIPRVEEFFPADGNDLILYFITNPPSATGFGEPDLGAGYIQMPGDSPVRPTLHPIYATQQQDSIKAHVETELAPVVSHLQQAGYNVSVEVGFDKDPIDAILRIIKSRKINLVAMSTRARVGVTRFFFRNIADTLAEKAQVPVLLTHPKG